jgi:hypothetical protein
LQQGWHDVGLSALGGCLRFALDQPEVDAVIVGVNRLRELDDIVAAAGQSANVRLRDPAPSIDPLYLDASRWPRLVH